MDILEAKVLRDIFTNKSTTSQFLLGNSFQCFTLEDKCRTNDEYKVYGETAIPFGKFGMHLRKDGHLYQIFSERFKNSGIGQERGMIWIYNLAYQTYENWYNSPGVKPEACVMIHPGNKDTDTLGCLLPGMKRDIDAVRESEKAYFKIYKPIADWLSSGKAATIEYIDGRLPR
jgi:hypothetical protein